MRGRLLVVGGSASVDQFVGVAQSCIGAVSRADNLFDALADISRSSDREPIAAVAVSSDCAEFDAAIVIEAIQSVDRSVPVFLLYPQGEDMSAIAIREGYEDTIPLPAADHDVREALAPVGLVQPTRDGAQSRHHPTQPIEIDISGRDVPTTVVDTQIRRAMANAHPESPVAGGSGSSDGATGVSRSSASDGKNHDGKRHDGGSHGSRDGQPRQPDRPTPRDDAAGGSARFGQGRPSTEPRPRAEARHPARPASGSAPQSPRPDPAPAYAAAPATPATTPERANGEPDANLTGDLALVRCIRRSRPLRDAALHEMRDALGTQDVRLVAIPRPGEEETIARERAGLVQAHVVGERGTYGTLLSGSIDAAILASWSRWLAEWLDLEAEHLEFRRLSTLDQLTGAHNRHAFEQLVPAILDEARARRRTISLMYFDIDDFKQYNDSFGHVAGDEVLRETVAVLQQSIRNGDLVFRMGGDEFVVLFCDPNPPRHGGSGVPENIKEIAERCRSAVRRMQVPMLDASGPGPVTISAGCALFPWDSSDAKALLDLADLRALEAKRDGKDQINFGPDRFTESERG
jgi:diguanylate cyclase (GGDEF)-like protein